MVQPGRRKLRLRVRCTSWPGLGQQQSRGGWRRKSRVASQAEAGGVVAEVQATVRGEVDMEKAEEGVEEGEADVEDTEVGKEEVELEGEPAENSSRKAELIF